MTTKIPPSGRVKVLQVSNGPKWQVDCILHYDHNNIQHS